MDSIQRSNPSSAEAGDFANAVGSEGLSKILPKKLFFFFLFWLEAYISEVKIPEQLPIMLICHITMIKMHNDTRMGITL